MIIDYETQSAIDLNRCGSHRYLTDPSTRLLSMAVQTENGQKYFYVPDFHKIELPASVDGIPIIRTRPELSNSITAHNATGFESIATRRFFKFEPEWIDTIALARQNGLPGALGKVADRLAIGRKLDGLKSVLLMQPKGGKYPQGTLPLWLSILRYNMQDVNLTAEIVKRFPVMQEPEVVKVDQTINHRGIYVNKEFTQNLIDVYHKHETVSKNIASEKYHLDGDDLWSVQKVSRWLHESCGVKLDKLNRQEVAKFIEDPSEYSNAEDENIQNAIKLLNLRRSVVRVGAAKLERLLDMVTDSRFRGGMNYAAAHTWRWGGYGVQPHNLPTPVKNLDYEDLCHDLTYKKVLAAAQEKKVDPADILNSLIRPCFQASAGKRLVIADYSMIEARMIAWLARDTAKIELLNSGADPYTEFGNKIGMGRQEGKIGILGAGYGMGKHRCAAQYKIPIEKATLLIESYRKSFPMVVKYWSELHKAALQAMECGQSYAGVIKFERRENHLRVYYPSGRYRCYRDAVVRPAVAGWRKLYGAPAIEEPTFFYRHPKGYECDMYGGKWAENISQGCCRDILADLLVKVEFIGMQVVLHVHDEPVLENDESDIEHAKDELTNLMSAPVEWAPGLKLTAKGFTSQAYIKQ